MQVFKFLIFHLETYFNQIFSVIFNSCKKHDQLLTKPVNNKIFLNLIDLENNCYVTSKKFVGVICNIHELKGHESVIYQIIFNFFF